MSASPFDAARSSYLRSAYRYLLATLLCAVFGAVYESFSHEVYSLGMLYAFGFPLLGGVFPALFLAMRGVTPPDESTLQLWGFGISTLTVGSLFSGALEIYGTGSRLTIVYWVVGGMCLLLSVITVIFIPDEKGDTADGICGPCH